MEVGEYQERSLSRGVWAETWRWGQVQNKGAEAPAQKRGWCERRSTTSTSAGQRAGAWDRGAPARTVPGHGRPRLGAGLLLKAKGCDCRAWTNQGRGVISLTLKGHSGCLEKNRPRVEAGSSVRRCPAKLRQNKTKTETDEQGLDFEARALSLAETGWRVSRQWEKEKKNQECLKEQGRTEINSELARHLPI